MIKKLLLKLDKLELEENVWLLLFGCSTGMIFWITGNLIISISDWQYASHEKPSMFAPEDVTAPEHHTQGTLAVR